MDGMRDDGAVGPADGLSVVIVNWNTRELLVACLASLRKFAYQGPFQVIVVDNNSSDGSAETVRREFPEVCLVALDKNTGYAKGNNVGFQNAEHAFVLTLNPDTEVVDDSLKRAVDVLRSYSRAGALGVKQVAVDGSTQQSVRGFPSFRGILGDLFKIRIGSFDSYRMARFDYLEEQEAPQPMGTFLLLRRRALVQIGDAKNPFDESFPIFFNEVDLLYRLDLAGWSCIYTPKARILHHGGESTKQVRANMIWESHRSLLRFMQKQYGTGLSRIALWFLAPIVYAAAFVRAKGYHAGFRP